MRLDWLLNPTAQYAALALGLLFCLYLFVSAKMEMRAVERLAEETRDTLQAAVSDLATDIARIREEAALAPPPQREIAGGLNLTRRAHVLRLSRNGETAERIAATLQAPRSEIELLLKLPQAIEKS